LLPDDGAEEWGLGWSVALDGDTAIIGAGDTDSCQYGTCSDGVYVFTRTGTAWNEQAKLIPGDEYIGEGYGRYIVLNDDTALIGAPYDDDNGEDSGSVYVFTRTDHTWTEQAQLLAKDGTSDDNFGMAVALDGGTAVMAAPNYRPTGFSDASGMAYVFTRTGSTWTQQSNLASNDLSPNVGFGESVAIDGNTVVIGAPTDHDPGEFDPYGSAYIPDCCINSRSWASSAESVESPEAMQQLVFQLFVAIHGQDQFAGRANNTSGALNEGAAQCSDFAETPQRCPFGRGGTRTGRHSHL
jgi:hypothetical protein